MTSSVQWIKNSDKPIKFKNSEQRQKSEERRKKRKKKKRIKKMKNRNS